MAKQTEPLQELERIGRRAERLARDLETLDAQRRELLIQLARDRHPVSHLARAAHLHRATVHRILRAAGLAHLADRSS